MLDLHLQQPGFFAFGYLSIMKGLFVCVFLLFGVCACSTSRGGEGWADARIAVGAGPEDMVLDTFHGAPRFLVSCHDRRAGAEGVGGFWVVDPETQKAEEFARTGEPAWLLMAPHGIDLVQMTDGPRLFTIVHDDREQAGKGGVHRIVVYRVLPDRLVFEDVYADPLLNSPNAVCALPDGGLLVTNDSGKRGSRMEGLLKRKKSTVVYRDPRTGKWSVAVDGLSYANGITHRNGAVYVATSRQNRVFRYRLDEGQLLDRVELGRVPGGDNLRWDGHDLLVPGHPNMLAFVRHAGSAKRSSPVELWRVNTGSGNGPSAEPVRIWSDDGSRISGASTAIAYGGRYWLCQVFEPYVLVLEPPAGEAP